MKYHCLLPFLKTAVKADSKITVMYALGNRRAHAKKS